MAKDRSGSDLHEDAQSEGVELFSKITCPQCGHREKEQMPTNACQFFYYCKSCDARLRPLAGDCCVYCSYGTVPCPPIQLAKGKSGNNGSCC